MDIILNVSYDESNLKYIKMIDIIINGIVEFTWIGYVIYTLIVTHITIVAITLYLHRGVCHSAIEIKPALGHFFRFWLWLTTSMRTADWVAIHRKHHAKVETIDDPHSPAFYGIKNVLLRGADLYHDEKNNAETISKYSQNCPKDWVEEHVYTGRNNQGILILFIGNILLFGVVGIIIWAIQMAWTPIFAAGGINGAGHYWGYRNYDTSDDSTNMAPVGILIGGEELHNNHHAFPTAAKFSLKPWEFDIGWLYIKIFSAIGQINVKRLAPKTVVNDPSETLDSETGYALLRSKLTVITNYTKTVLSPLLKQESMQASNEFKTLLKRSKPSLVREPHRISNQEIVTLDEIFKKSVALKTAYNLKNKLFDILHSRNLKHESFIETINAWRDEAQNEGIDCLIDFSNSLKGYKVIK
ncbi:MAG: acyl-CoA desaturase [Gammaproteobacteria bacterium]|nr:acyl-CoA desaturase [Gammaproteobacteria bacterium]MBT7076774.1 acyl-CoA desaturase [Pelagibacterales bacterium]MBT5116819.1 acyl-CoA desaturase [Gammaproteobacteria bacterium]MBT5761669.1 acyl-CoA desaturase [Gammaproteobacteria bacterium]MBT6331100.1 acyl-CoA desaturase [Gammaproteobacteria bacterium]